MLQTCSIYFTVHWHGTASITKYSRYYTVGHGLELLYNFSLYHAIKQA